MRAPTVGLTALLSAVLVVLLAGCAPLIVRPTGYASGGTST